MLKNDRTSDKITRYMAGNTYGDVYEKEKAVNPIGFYKEDIFYLKISSNIIFIYKNIQRK